MCFQRHTKSVAVTLTGVDFDTHQRYRMFYTVQESMEIFPYELTNDVRIIPLPDNFSTSCLYRFCSNVSWYSQIRIMYITDAILFDTTLKIILAEFRTIHAYGVLAYINKAPNTSIKHSIY